MAIISLQPDPISAVLDASLAIVIPIYNEEANIKQVVAEWEKELEALSLDFQFILINDGSRDNTLDVLRQLESTNPKRFVVVDKINSGHGRTCRLGYEAAVASPKVEWVLQIDSDGQCDPSYFDQFWKSSKNADCVFGKRIRRDDGFARSLTSKICKLGASFLGGQDLVDPNVPYRLIRREVLSEALARIPASFNIHNVAVTFIIKKMNGVRWSYVPIRFLDRQGGNNSINLLNVTQWGIDMLLELRRLK